MTKTEFQLGLLSKDKRRQLIDEIVRYFQVNRDERIGVIAAEEILDFFLDSFGKTVYNKGIKDAQILLKQRLSDFDVDLEALILDDRINKNK